MSLFKIYITFYARQLNYYHTIRGSCANIRVFGWNGEFCVCFTSARMIVFLLKIVRFDFDWNARAYSNTRDTMGACANCIKLLLHVTRKVYLFLYWRQKSARLNTMTNDQHGTSTRYVYLTFRRHAISVSFFFVCCHFNWNLRFLCNSYDKICSGFCWYLIKMDRNYRQQDDSSQMNCTVLIDHARDFIGFDFG